MHTRTEPVIAVLGSTVRDGEALPVLRSRLAAAAKQRQIAERHGFDPHLICLGGMGSAGVEAEAPVMASRLVALGVPRSRIIEEVFSSTTEENLLHLRMILSDPGFPESWAGRAGTDVPDVRTLTRKTDRPRQPIVIVTSRFHLPRTMLMARRLGLNAYGVAAPNTGWNGLLSIPREIGALILWGVRSLRRTVS